MGYGSHKHWLHTELAATFYFACFTSVFSFFSLNSDCVNDPLFFPHVRPLPHLTSRLTLSLRLFYLSLLGFWLPRIASLVNAHFMLRKHMKAKPHAWSIPATHGLDTVLVFSCSLYYCLVSHRRWGNQRNRWSCCQQHLLLLHSSQSSPDPSCFSPLFSFISLSLFSLLCFRL